MQRPVVFALDGVPAVTHGSQRSGGARRSAGVVSSAGDLEQQLNNSFAAQLPKALRQRRQRVAIDLILIPYHGQPTAASRRSIAVKPRAHHPLSCLCDRLYRARGRRFTVALTPSSTCRPGDVSSACCAPPVGPDQAQLAPTRPCFYSVDVIRYLQAARYPFIMPAICRGRRADDPRGPSGTRVFATTTATVGSAIP